MKLRACLAALILLFFMPVLTAGEIASFVNLGFSEDSKTFMFGMYGIEEATSFPWAEAYIVDVEKNRFSENGSGRLVGKKSVTLGQDGSGALYGLIRSMSARIDTLKLDHTNAGRLVYILLNGAKEQESIQFRDFETSRSYQVSITQSLKVSQGNPDQKEAAFGLNIQMIGKDGKTRTVSTGNPSYFRKDVDKYLVRQIVLSPDEKSLVFVVEKISIQKNGFSSSFMVETARID